LQPGIKMWLSNAGGVPLHPPLQVALSLFNHSLTAWLLRVSPVPCDCINSVLNLN